MIILLGFASSILVFLISFWFFSKTDSSLGANPKAKVHDQSPFSISSRDIHAIAGDDVITTQLDLARAYMETGRTQLAKNILKNAIVHGSPEQQDEAKQLILTLEQSDRAKTT